MDELAKVGLKPGLTYKNGVRVYVSCSDNGWMQHYHMESVAKMHEDGQKGSGPRKWRILTVDGWHYYVHENEHRYVTTTVRMLRVVSIS